MRTCERSISRRSARSCSRPGVATRMCAPLARLACELERHAAVDGRDLEALGLGERLEARRSPGRRARASARARAPTGAHRRPSSARRSAGRTRASCPSRSGLGEHVEARERVRQDELPGSRNGSMDRASGERVDDGRGHAELAERLLRHVVRLLCRVRDLPTSKHPKEEREAHLTGRPDCRPVHKVPVTPVGRPGTLLEWPGDKSEALTQAQKEQLEAELAELEGPRRPRSVAGDRDRPQLRRPLRELRVPRGKERAGPAGASDHASCATGSTVQ